MTVGARAALAANECVAEAIVAAINAHRGSNPAANDNEFVLSVLKTIAWELSEGFYTDGDGKIRRYSRSEPVEKLEVVPILKRFTRA